VNHAQNSSRAGRVAFGVLSAASGDLHGFLEIAATEGDADEIGFELEIDVVGMKVELGMSRLGRTQTQIENMDRQ